MEERNLKAYIGKAGGTAGSESLNYKMSIPSAWAQKMGISSEDRNLIVKFDEKELKITVEKA